MKEILANSGNITKDDFFAQIKTRTNKQALADQYIQQQIGNMDDDVLGELGIRRVL